MVRVDKIFKYSLNTIKSAGWPIAVLKFILAPALPFVYEIIQKILLKHLNTELPPLSLSFKIALSSIIFLSMVIWVFLKRSYELENPKIELRYIAGETLYQAGENKPDGNIIHDFSIGIINNSGVPIQNLKFKLLSITGEQHPLRPLHTYLRMAGTDSDNVNLPIGESFFPLYRHIARTNGDYNGFHPPRFQFCEHERVFSEPDEYKLHIVITADNAPTVEKIINMFLMNGIGLSAIRSIENVPV